MAMLLDAEPPRAVRGMAEYYLPTIPSSTCSCTARARWSGRPRNCAQLLERGEAIMVFPEGERGFVKPFAKRYQLQRFGLGFLRLALETETPIVPVGIVGSRGAVARRWRDREVARPPGRLAGRRRSR